MKHLADSIVIPKSLSYSEAFGMSVFLIRQNAGLKQTQLATILHLSRSQACKLESGKSTLSVVQLRTLSDGLGIGYNKFFKLANYIHKLSNKDA